MKKGKKRSPQSELPRYNLLRKLETNPVMHTLRCIRSKSLSEVEKLRLLVAKLEAEVARLKRYYVKGVGANKVFVTSKDKNMR